MTLFSANTSTAQIKLAGVAAFPEKEHKNWLDVQLNPNLGEEEKIKSTVNTFFILMYESRKRREILDAGFLFDLDNQSAYKSYAYERGLSFLKITGGTFWNIHLRDYDYKPIFYKFEVSENESTVEILPNAYIAYSDAPKGMYDKSSYGNYSIELILKENSWLILDVFCDDEGHQFSPPGGDYVVRAKSVLYSNITAWEESQIITTKQREEKEKRTEIFRKLLGKYKFKAQGQSIIISFSMRYDIIHGYWVEKSEETALYPIRNKELEFFSILDNGEIYDFRFFMDKDGKLINCLMRVSHVEYIGKRIAVKELD